MQSESLNIRAFAKFACCSKMTANILVMVVCLSVSMYSFFLVEFQL